MSDERKKLSVSSIIIVLGVDVASDSDEDERSFRAVIDHNSVRLRKGIITRPLLLMAYQSPGYSFVSGYYTFIFSLLECIFLLDWYIPCVIQVMCLLLVSFVYLCFVFCFTCMYN